MSSAPDVSAEAAGRLVVLDPGGLWSRWGALRGEEEAGPAPLRIEVLARGPVPACDAVLVLVPAKGLDRREYDWVRQVELPGVVRLFAAGLTRSDLVLTGRNDPGHVALAREVDREFGASLLPIPDETEARFVPEMLRLIRQQTLMAVASRQTQALVNSLAELAEPLTGGEPSALPEAASLDILARRFSGSFHAGLLADALELALRQADSEAAQAAALDAAWNTLAAGLRDECARLARGARFHGDLAEELVAGMGETLDAVAQELDRWTAPPFPELAAWADNAREQLRTPQLCMPVVGVFSSGKTTLFNHLLGKTPKELPFFRTSLTHNTALLCRFHPRRAGPNRVEMTYRSQFQISLITPAWPSDLAVCAGMQGTIKLLQPRAGGGYAVLLVNPSGHREWIFIDRGKPLLRRIQPGVHLNPGDPLTEGPRPQDWEERYFENRTDLRIETRIKAARALIGLLRQGALRGAQWGVRLRVPSLLSYKLEPAVISQEDDPAQFWRWLDWLDQFVHARKDEPEIGLYWVRQTSKPYPIEMRLEAQVFSKDLPPCHKLETDDDWDWFQGPATESTTKSREAGFSEGPVAAYLVERTDLYLDSPLFQLVSLVDTPGLNSITDLHERITEEFIHQGHAFILLCRLDRGSYEEATARAIGAMLTSLVEQQVPRSEYADRIFFVLNWFRDEARAGRNDAEARDLVKDFHELASRMIESPYVRLYVVDLSPGAFHQRERPAMLLGRPSLQGLIDDLHEFLRRQGLSPRLQALAASLRRTWNEKLGALERQEVDAGSDPEVSLAGIESAVRRLATGGALRTELRARAETAFDELLTPVRNLRHGLDNLSDKGDFASFQTAGANLMQEYNATRQLLMDSLASEINAALRARLGHVLDEVPRIPGVESTVKKLPTMANGTFSITVGAIVVGWPSGLGRFWKLLTNFEFHRTTKRNELIREFVPDARIQEIETLSRAGREELTAQIDQACEKGLETLHQRQQRVTASMAQRTQDLKEVADKRRTMSEFRQRYQAMAAVLERAAERKR